jgi:hypothetical protein
MARSLNDSYSSVMGKVSLDAARDKYYADMFSGKNAEDLRWLSYYGQQTGDMDLATRAAKKASDLHIDTEYNKLPDHAKSGRGKLGGLTYAEKTQAIKSYSDAQAIASGKAYRSSTGHVIHKGPDANSPEVKFARR